MSKAEKMANLSFSVMNFVLAVWAGYLASKHYIEGDAFDVVLYAVLSVVNLLASISFMLTVVGGRRA